MSNRSRLSLDLSGRQSDDLETYTQKHGVTKAEALRRAITFLLECDRAKEEGFKIGAWGSQNGVEIQREFVIV